MSAHPIDPQRTEAGVLDGFIMLVRRDLKQRILAAIDANIEASIDAAIKDLNPSIQSHFDAMSRDYMVKISVNTREQNRA